MSWITCGQLLRSSYLPLMQTVRHRARKPNLRRPAIPHWKRAVILKLTEPVYADPLKDIHPARICDKKQKMEQKKLKQINPFEQILAHEFYEKVDNSKMIAIFHMNPMTADELFTVRVQLAKIGLHYFHHNNEIAKLAFSGTKYEALLQLYQSKSTTFISDEANVAKLLRLQKKISSLLLLAGVLEGRFMSVSDLQRYASLPALPVLQSQLVGILNAPVQRLSQNLTHHQAELSSSLGRYISDQTSVKTNEASTENPSEEPSTS